MSCIAIHLNDEPQVMSGGRDRFFKLRSPLHAALFSGTDGAVRGHFPPARSQFPEPKAFEGAVVGVRCQLGELNDNVARFSEPRAIALSTGSPRRE